MTLNILIGNGSWYPVAQSGGSPVLVTPPSISVFFSAGANNVEVLGANAGVYEQEDGVVLTGTTGAADLISKPSATTAIFYIGSNVNASSNNDEYNGWYLFADGISAYAPPAYCGILAYDGATKQVTVEWQSSQSPTVGGQWKLIKNYPVLRKGQWKRNGVAISGEETRTYAVTSSDVGQSITYEETVGFADWTWDQTGSLTPPLPTSSTVSVSAPYIPTSTISTPTKIRSQADFTYLGSFRSPVGVADCKLSIVPANQSQNGQVSLLLTNVQSSEISIPALLINSNPNSLNTATQTRSSSDIYDGWAGIGKTGLVNGNITGGVLGLSGTTDIIASDIGYYTSQQSNYFVKRSSDITLPQSLNPFCVIPTNQSNQRWAGGSIVEIPETLQTALGGTLLVGSGLAAIAGANAQTPAGMSFNESDVNAAIANFTTGTVQSGTTTTAVLDPSASSAPGFYVGWQVVFSISGSTSSYTADITAYTGSSGSPARQITFASFGTSVPAGATYSLIAPVSAKQLYGNATAYEPDNKMYPYMWNTVGGSFNYSTFIPRGTTSVVNVTPSWQGRVAYGFWMTYPSATGEWGGISTYKERLYSSIIYPNVSPGPRQGSIWTNDSNSYLLFWVYDSSDLADVVAGIKTYNQINPFSVFSFALPYPGGESGPASVAFDNVNNRLYVYQLMYVRGYGVYRIVSVYSCNKYI